MEMVGYYTCTWKYMGWIGLIMDWSMVWVFTCLCTLRDDLPDCRYQVWPLFPASTAMVLYSSLSCILHCFVVFSRVFLCIVYVLKRQYMKSWSSRDTLLVTTGVFGGEVKYRFHIFTIGQVDVQISKHSWNMYFLATPFRSETQIFKDQSILLFHYQSSLIFK